MFLLKDCYCYCSVVPHTSKWQPSCSLHSWFLILSSTTDKYDTGIFRSNYKWQETFLHDQLHQFWVQTERLRDPLSCHHHSHTENAVSIINTQKVTHRPFLTCMQHYSVLNCTKLCSISMTCNKPSHSEAHLHDWTILLDGISTYLGAAR